MLRIRFNEMDTLGKIGTATSVASGIATLASAIIDIKETFKITEEETVIYDEEEDEDDV